MNLEELARQAGLTEPDLKPWMTDYGNAEQAIKRFAALVLEEAARLCDIKPGTERWEVQGGEDGAQLCDSLAAAIRALKPDAAAQEPDDTAEDLYDRLHSLSKSLEGSGRLDEHDNPDAYATVLDAMNYVRRGTVAS